MQVQQQNFDKLFKVNEQITAKEVRVIDGEGKMLGLMSPAQGIKLANDSGLDLVEVSPHTTPPVCKIANFGKMKYEMQKKAADARKKQKIIDTKEVKISLNIGKSDYDVKVKQILRFIEKGDKVKVSLRVKGREMAHLELVDKLMESLSNDVSDHAKYESQPKMEGRQMTALLVKK